MAPSAPGQFLGYAIQVPRALLHLLNAAPGHVVCVEVVGDVATIANGSVTISEEDKSSLDSNPLGNKSKNLWKTFFNWIEDVNNAVVDTNNADFVLFATHGGRPGLVNDFHNASNGDEALRAIATAKSKLKDITKEHEIWKYFDFCTNKNSAVFAKVIENFELQVGSKTGGKEIEEALVRKHLPEGILPALTDALTGWLHKELLACISEQKPALITWETFDKQFKVLFDQARCHELTDFTKHSPIDEVEIENQKQIWPPYLEQLHAIEIDGDGILQAVTDYLRAKVNRLQWIESETLDIELMDDFQRRLVTYWQNRRQSIQITERTAKDTDRGKLLLLDCAARQETIRNINPPDSTISGTYHALADELTLGWHPDWEALFKPEQ